MELKLLETERLILRPWTLEDAQDLYDYAQSPAVGPAAGWKPHESLEESRKIIREMFIPGEDCWAMQLKRDGHVVGSIGLHEDCSREKGLPVRMLGYVLAERCWGQGLMQEACREVLRYGFREAGLELISVFHFTFNGRSRRTIEALGFIKEGTRRMASTLYDGTVADEVAYSMTRAEFEEICKKWS